MGSAFVKRFFYDRNDQQLGSSELHVLLHGFHRHTLWLQISPLATGNTPTMTHNRAQAGGLDLGGTKIEAQVFDPKWDLIDQKRVATPQTYPELVTAIAGLIQWIETTYGGGLPIGIGAAGLVHPVTGRALTANICASSQPLPADIKAAAQRDVTYLNDCRALALSEAVFGSGKGHRTVASVILGTGIGGGLAFDGALPAGPTGTGGEFGHTSAPAALIAQNGLPIFPCGCGRDGCIETYISGAGLERLALSLCGTQMSPPDIAAQRDTTAAPVWAAWCALVGDFLRNLILTLDPDVIVLGGGLSSITGVADALARATQDAQIEDFTVPPIVIAQGGAESGARGAAYAAWQAAQ